MDNYRKLRAMLPAEWSRDDFVLCGSAVLAAYGVRDVADLDVMVKPALWVDILGPYDRAAVGENMLSPRFAALGARFTTPHTKRGSTGLEEALEDEKGLERRQLVQINLFVGGCIDFFDAMPRIASCIEPEAVFADAIVHEGFKVVSLRHCLAVKALAKRPKDVADMVQLARLIEGIEAPATKPKPPEVAR